MKSYVLCHARPAWQIFWPDVLVLKKARPEWQAGWLNLPGGKIEEGETPREAAKRELKEETGIDTLFPKILGRVLGDDYEMFVLDCPFEGLSGQPLRYLPDEPASWMYVEPLLKSPLCLPSLRLFVPLCRAGVEGWTVYDRGSQSDFRIDLCAPPRT
jgi:8-oxo-dGTP diphosphatase